MNRTIIFVIRIKFSENMWCTVWKIGKIHFHIFWQKFRETNGDSEFLVFPQCVICSNFFKTDYFSIHLFLIFLFSNFHHFVFVPSEYLVSSFLWKIKNKSAFRKKDFTKQKLKYFSTIPINYFNELLHSVEFHEFFAAQIFTWNHFDLLEPQILQEPTKLGLFFT